MKLGYTTAIISVNLLGNHIWSAETVHDFKGSKNEEGTNWGMNFEKGALLASEKLALLPKKGRYSVLGIG